MTSISHMTVAIQVSFLNGAENIYGEGGLCPATEDSAGVDLRACPPDGNGVVIAPGERRAVPTGIAVAPLSRGVAGFVYSRSGLGAVKGLTVAQGVGVIDPDYRGEIRVVLLNTGRETYTVEPGERIAQIIFQPFARPSFHKVETLEETARGGGGFGHTGK